MKAVTFKYDTIFKKSMSFTMQISDELYDALQSFGAIKGGYSIDFNDN